MAEEDQQSAHFSNGSTTTIGTKQNSHIGSWLSNTWTLGGNWVSRNTLTNSAADLVYLQAETFSKRPIKTANTPLYADKLDEGYAWVILFSCIILQLIPPMSMASVGIFYKEFLDTYQRDERITSTMCALQTSLAMMLGPIPAAIMDRTSGRVCAMIGCIGAACFLFISSMVNNFEVLFFSYGIMTGFFLCCVYIPAAVMAAQYFDKYRPLALGLTTCSVPLIFLLVPPIAISLTESYSWRIANMFLAATCAQATVFAALLRPPRLEEPSLIVQYGGGAFPHHRSRTMFYNSHGKISLNSYRNSQYSVFGKESEASFEHKDGSCVWPPASLPLLHASGHGSDYQLSQHPHRSEVHLETILETAPLDIKPYTPESALEKGDDTEKIDIEPNNKLSTDQSMACRKISIVESPVKPYTDFIHWRLFVLILSCFFWGYGGSMFYVLIPEYAQTANLDSTQLSYLYMISGAAGVMLRIVLVLTGHYLKYSKVLATAVAFVVMGLAFVGIVFSYNFAQFAAVSSFFTMAYGCVACFGGPVILEMHGDKKIGMILGVEMLSYGIGAAISTPVATSMYNLRKSHTLSLIFTACLSLLAGILLIPHVIIKFFALQSDQNLAKEELSSGNIEDGKNSAETKQDDSPDNRAV